MQVTTGSEQLNWSAEGAGRILSTCSSTQTVPCMVCGVTNFKKDRLQPQRLRIGSLKRRLSAMGDGKSSSSCSLIPMGFCTGSQVASCTGGLPRHTAWTTGLEPLHWREQVAGASSNSYSSIPKGYCTASKTASFIRGILPFMHMTTGWEHPHSLALQDGAIFSSFSLWRMVSCMAFTVASSTSVPLQLITRTTGWVLQSWLAQVAGPCLNSWWVLWSEGQSSWQK